MDINAKFSLNSKVIPFMFGAYKFGLYAPEITPWAVTQFSKGEREALEKSDCLKITICRGRSVNTDIPVIQLTPIGLELLRKNFTHFLVEKGLYYTYLAIIRGDLLNVKDDI